MTASRPLGDESDLFVRHSQELVRAVACAVNAPAALIEDACQNAWAILLRRQPDRASVFGWLRVVAIHEAYRLWSIERRDQRLEVLACQSGAWGDLTPDPRTLESTIEAREALRAVACLPERQREDLSLQIAGYTYLEIAELTGGRSFTNVNKHLAKARKRIRGGHQQVSSRASSHPRASL